MLSCVQTNAQIDKWFKLTFHYNDSLVTC